MTPAAQQQQQSAADANGAAATAAGSTGDSAASKRNLFVQKYLTNCRSLYSCIYCRTHLANHDELVSRSFQGNRSRAYLFNAVVNVSCGPAVQRELNTGSHSVADIHCANCRTTIGWKYEKAYVETQKYKEGKFIIELAHVVRENRHLEFDKRDMIFGAGCSSRSSSSAAAATTATKTIVNNGRHQQQVLEPRRRRSWRNSLRDSSLSPTSSSSGGGGGTGPSWSSPSASTSSSNDDEMMLYHGHGRPSNDGVDDMLTSTMNQVSVDDDRGQDGEEEEEDDDEDEFMFPMYDDLMCGNRSSYSSLSAISRLDHNRIRRSLYFESTPYDWKYSASATSPPPSSKTGVQQQVSSPAAIRLDHDSTNDSVLDERAATSSSSSCENTNNICDNQQQRQTGAMSSSVGLSPSTSSSVSNSNERLTGNNKSSGSEKPPNARTENETQFKFDIDDPPLSTNHNNPHHDQINKEFSSSRVGESNRDVETANNSDHDGHKRGASSSTTTTASKENVDGDDEENSICDSTASNRTVENNNTATRTTTPATATKAATVANKSPKGSPLGSRTNSVSLDDEQFYDCNTEHDVQQFQW